MVLKAETPQRCRNAHTSIVALAFSVLSSVFTNTATPVAETARVRIGILTSCGTLVGIAVKVRCTSLVTLTVPDAAATRTGAGDLINVTTPVAAVVVSVLKYDKPVTVPRVATELPDVAVNEVV
jgi:hypothetical protein